MAWRPAPGTLAQLALVGAGVTVAYVLARRVFAGLTAGAAVVTEPIAQTYVDWTSPGVQSLAKIQLPNGQRIEPGAVHIEHDFGFVYGGVRYRLTGRNIDGNYDAVLVDT